MNDVSEEDPRQQGLKQSEAGDVAGLDRCQRGRSTTTRIETVLIARASLDCRDVSARKIHDNKD